MKYFWWLSYMWLRWFPVFPWYAINSSCYGVTSSYTCKDCDISRLTQRSNSFRSRLLYILKNRNKIFFSIYHISWVNLEGVTHDFSPIFRHVDWRTRPHRFFHQWKRQEEYSSPHLIWQVILATATTITSDGTLALKFQVQVVLPLIPSLPGIMLVQRKRDFYCSLWLYVVTVSA
jgi:hypothetical protein